MFPSYHPYEVRRRIHFDTVRQCSLVITPKIHFDMVGGCTTVFLR